MNRDRTSLLDVGIDTRELSVVCQESIDAIAGRRGQVVFACANPHSLVTARSDETFQRALNDADQVVSDGVGITMLSKLAGVRVGPRITGSDYFLSVMGSLNELGRRRVFFFGSTPKVLDLIASKVPKDFPNLECCGALSPPFGVWSDEENRLMLETINASKPDLVWVGMTAPKQEKWVFQNRGHLSVPVIGSIGAVFDFYAGTYPRAPAWACRLGLEWVFRLLKEPRRMWRRNFISTPLFAYMLVRERLERVLRGQG